MMTRRMFALCLASLLSVPAIADPQLPRGQGAPPPTPPPSQGSSSPQEPSGPIRIFTTRVVVPVTVKDHEGRLVGDLEKKNSASSPMVKNKRSSLLPQIRLPCLL